MHNILYLHDETKLYQVFFLFRTKSTLQKDIGENEDLVRRRHSEVQVSRKVL